MKQLLLLIALTLPCSLFAKDSYELSCQNDFVLIIQKDSKNDSIKTAFSIRIKDIQSAKLYSQNDKQYRLQIKTTLGSQAIKENYYYTEWVDSKENVVALLKELVRKLAISQKTL